LNVHRLSVNGLLKSVIANVAVSVMVVLALAPGAHGRGWLPPAASRRCEASSHLFTRCTPARRAFIANRDLLGDKQLPGRARRSSPVRAAENAGLAGSLRGAADRDFADRQAMITTWIRHQTADGAAEETRRLHQPKAARRSGLAKEFFRRNQRADRACSTNCLRRSRVRSSSTTPTSIN